jgi:hypothetical protein
MRRIQGLAAVLLGTTLLAGAAFAKDDNPPPPHPHFTAHGHQDRDYATAPSYASNQPRSLTPNTAAVGKQGAYTGNSSRQRGAHSGAAWTNSRARWNASSLRDHNVAHWSAEDRTRWQHGHWWHGRHSGRNGWWWYTDGAWFFYDQPIYPYPGYASDYYYYGDYGDEAYPDEGYGDDYAPGPDENDGYYWYYCSNPAGYYPYVQSCRGPWRAVSPTPPGAQQGYDQNQAPDANGDQGPPPGYNDNGPPPQGDQFNGPDANDQSGQPPGYTDDENGPPPGYTDDGNGPPPGYGNGQDDGGDNGLPPPH